MKYPAFQLALVGALWASIADSQTLKTLLQFSGSGGTAIGASPYGSLTLGGTTLYGMTTEGGAGYGNVFSVGTDGTNYQNLVSFTGSGTTGVGPFLVQGSLTLGGTTLYGMNSFGGADNYGNIFSVGTNGTNYQDLVFFTGVAGPAIGLVPRGSLTLSNSTLYGMTSNGGASLSGNVFCLRIDGSGFQNLYTFTGGNDGELPFGDLTFSGDTLFGVTPGGGANGYGTVFRLVLPTKPPP
jgi:hypothetical protein